LRAGRRGRVVLAEELDAVALVVVGVGGRSGLGGIAGRQAIGGPGRFQSELLRRVAEDEPAAALAAWVHDGTLGRRGELIEHLGAQTLHVLDRESPEAAPGKVSRSQKAAGLPVADRVLVYAQRAGGIANVQKLSSRHRPPTIAQDVVFVEYVDFVHSL